jgi:hypothetical protein
MDIICKKCGLCNDYSSQLKSNNMVATCNGCGSFIKNIPHQKPKFYIGKYKDKLIEEVDDLSYLKWFLENTNPKPSVRIYIIAQINKIELKNK